LPHVTSSTRRRPTGAATAKGGAALPILALLACGGVGPRMPYTLAPPVDEPRPRVISSAIDSSLATLGLPSLAEVTLPPAYRELRLTPGHGMILGQPYPLIRITAEPDRVSGQVIFFQAKLSWGETPLRHLGWTARVARPRTSIDWGRVLATLDSLGVTTFQPPRYLVAYSDAGDLVVEVREGAAYRGYQVNAPHLRSDTISHRAAAMARIVDSLARLTGDR
jgi:hypothetical protein